MNRISMPYFGNRLNAAFIAFLVVHAALSACPAFAGSAPKRVVVLLPSLAETAVAILGDDSAIVGVSEYTDFPKSLAKKTSIGSYSKPNVETIVSLKPDLVLASEDGSPPEILRRLRGLRIRVVSVGTESLAKTRASFSVLGEALGKTKEATVALGKFDAEIAKIRARAESRKKESRPSRILVQVGDDPLIVAGRGSFLHEGLEILGLENAYAASKLAFPRIAVEDVLRKNPDVILLVALSDDLRTFERARARWMAYPTLAATKGEKIYILRSDSLVRPGPRFPAGLQELEAVIFPSEGGVK
jgi:iron complex transport system substrate-binding protein